MSKLTKEQIEKLNTYYIPLTTKKRVQHTSEYSTYEKFINWVRKDTIKKEPYEEVVSSTKLYPLGTVVESILKNLDKIGESKG